MGMTRREFRGLAVLAALLAIVVTITAITQCRRQEQRTAATQQQATASDAAAENAATDTNIVELTTKGDSAVINFHPTLRAGAAQDGAKKFSAKKRANLKAFKQKPGRKVKPMQPDRKSPLESPV